MNPPGHELKAMELTEAWYAAMPDQPAYSVLLLEAMAWARNQALDEAAAIPLALDYSTDHDSVNLEIRSMLIAGRIRALKGGAE